MTRRTIDLNCDMGESFGIYNIGMDAEVMNHISSANIACGWHAGDPVVMNQTVRLAAEGGIGCGAHPGYPDLLGFGRRKMDVQAEDLKCYLLYQIGALRTICMANGVTLGHVKPHGSLYLSLLEDESVAEAVAEAIAAVDASLVFVTLAGQKGEMAARVGERFGLQVAFEGFPDRAYTPQGTLVPRSQPGAVIEDPSQVVQRALQMASEGRVKAINGDVIDLRVQTLCVHGDNPGAVEMVRRIRLSLEAEDIQVLPMLGYQ